MSLIYQIAFTIFHLRNLTQNSPVHYATLIFSLSSEPKLRNTALQFIFVWLIISSVPKSYEGSFLGTTEVTSVQAVCPKVFVLQSFLKEDFGTTELRSVQDTQPTALKWSKTAVVINLKTTVL